MAKEKTIRRVTKVKYQEGKKVNIHWEDQGEGDSQPDAHKDSLRNPPKDSFRKALQAMAPWLLKFMEEPPGRINKLLPATVVTEVSIKRNDEGALLGQIKGHVALMKNDRRRPISMGYICEDEEEGEIEGTTYGMTLANLCDEATKYLDGHRERIPETGNLFEQGEGDE